MSCNLNLFSLESALKTLLLLLQEEEIFLFSRPPFLKMKCSGKFWHSFCGRQHPQHEKPFADLSFIQCYIPESSKPDTLYPFSFSTKQWQNNLLFFPVLFLEHFKILQLRKSLMTLKTSMEEPLSLKEWTENLESLNKKAFMTFPNMKLILQLILCFQSVTAPKPQGKNSIRFLLPHVQQPDKIRSKYLKPGVGPE